MQINNFNYYKVHFIQGYNYRKRLLIYNLKILFNRITKTSKLGLSFPKEINIGGRMFNIQEHEGLISFSSQTQYNFSGCHERVSFSHPKYAQWHMEYSTSFKKIRPSFVYDTYKIVCDYRGDDFNRDMAVDGCL